MIAFLIKRFVWLLLTLWIVFTISFFLMRAAPGGPFSSERKLTPDVKRAMEKEYRLDKPIYWQYGDRLWRTFRWWDLGKSTKLKDFTVNEVIRAGFPVSATLGLVALIFALSLGLTAGIISALYRQTVLDVSLIAIATIGIAVPNFWLASVGIIISVFYLQLLPAAGWGTLSNVILPALCLGAPYAAYIARLTRTGMLDVLNQDYIRTARAKGLPSYKIVIHHALKGAVLPVVSFMGPATAGILTGSLVLESMFNIPGMGTHFIEAAFQRDYPMAMGVVLVYTLLLYSMNTLVDISYSLLDPRVKLD
ncbi:MAG: ABC transporter permease [Pirellulales bacterium]